MTVGFLQAKSLLVEFAVTFDGISSPALAQFFHRVFILRAQKYDDRRILRKVESINGIGSHIQHTVTSLKIYIEISHVTHVTKLVGYTPNQYFLSEDNYLYESTSILHFTARNIYADSPAKLYCRNQ